jgi:hypothetical protein
MARVLVIVRVEQIVDDPGLITGNDLVNVARANITVGADARVKASRIAAGEVFGATALPGIGNPPVADALGQLLDIAE